MAGIPSPAQAIRATLEAVDSTLTSVGVAAEAVHTSLSIDVVRAQVQRGLPVTATPPKIIKKASMPAILFAQHSFQLEDVLTLLSHSLNGPVINNIEQKAVSILYRDLPHPPSTHVEQEFHFRSADGSGNSLINTNLGKSITPYSRNCSTTRSISDDELPGPGLIFDTLLCRSHNNASYSIHPGALRLNINPSVRPPPRRTEWFVLQLRGILYGNTQGHHDKIHHKDGRGRLLPDVFSETRLLSLPPDVAASRRDTLSWSLDITSEWRQADHTLLERGRGNSYSVEFNTIYRWHPTLSLDDTAYVGMDPFICISVKNAFQRIFNHGQPFDFDTITVDHFEHTLSGFLVPKLHDKDSKPIPPADIDSLTEGVSDLRDNSKLVDYLQLSIPNLRRDPHTKLYSHDDLARILQRATKVPAGAFRTRGVPGVLGVIEILGIRQARSWGRCTLNDFQRFPGLNPHATFGGWVPDRSMAETARKLYRSIEDLALYVGLAAEEARGVIPGSRLCPPYTTARAIVANAIVLVRYGRYLTYDFTPFNLTTDAESVYTHIPLIIPTSQPRSIDNILEKNGYAGQYSLDPPAIQPVTRLFVDPNVIRATLRDDFFVPADDIIDGDGMQDTEHSPPHPSNMASNHHDTPVDHHIHNCDHIHHHKYPVVDGVAPSILLMTTSAESIAHRPTGSPPRRDYPSSASLPSDDESTIARSNGWVDPPRPTSPSATSSRSTSLTLNCFSIAPHPTHPNTIFRGGVICGPRSAIPTGLSLAQGTDDEEQDGNGSEKRTSNGSMTSVDD
ncbi:hypothetical protein BS47DRAFT_1394400 [Hydnum rufescens UP504]|uniref:Uncharacterized protein n=1 Tax=Hydnum rufescens UP504 TaxID=1448309 RepID=A0A9P6DV38_9AGAM|nr:hypothetical protein BS47DRAFT_1394400 [Hydnum rufescens UP504]